MWGAAMPAARRVLLLILALLLLLLFLAVPSVSLAQLPASPSPLADAARQLSHKLVWSFPLSQVFSLSLQNRSELSAVDTAIVYREIEAELFRQNKRIVAENAGVTHIRITLSENLDGLLWIAEVLGGDSRTIVVVTVPHPARHPSATSTPRLIIKHELLWEQVEPILDLTLLADQSGSLKEMLLLEPLRILIYRKEENRWKLHDLAALMPPSPPSRDPRGRIDQGIGKFDLHLSGAHCEAWILASLMTKCQPGSFPWPEFNGIDGSPARMVPGRNYFVAGPLSGTETSRVFSPHFSQAPLPHATQSATIMFAGIDGRARVYDYSGEEREPNVTGWGSDLVLLDVACTIGDDLGGAVLATRPSDWTQNDAVTAFAFVDRRPMAASPPLEFPGPITVLWPMSDEEALVVVRNLETGRYEAHRLAISCGK